MRGQSACGFLFGGGAVLSGSKVAWETVPPIGKINLIFNMFKFK